MQYLNILYFFIITIVGYRFLISNGKILKSELIPGQKVLYTGGELFWVLTFSTGLLAFSLDVGFDLMAIRLGVLMLFFLLGLYYAKEKPIKSPAIKIYFAYMLWLVIGLFYSPSAGYSIRVILKYLYPLLLCLFASATVRDAEVFFKASKWACIVGLITIFIRLTVFLAPLVKGVIWYGTAAAIHYISLMILSLGMFFFTKEKKKNLILAIIFILPCVIWVFRTSLMGSVVALGAFFFIKYHVKSLPVLATIVVLGIASVFYIPAVKEKMFYEPDRVTVDDFIEGTIDEENFNSNYRSTMWPKLKDLFYNDSKIIGSGTGAVQSYMYTHREEFSGLDVPHSDFIQQMCDNGLIGLIMYGSIIFFIFVDCFKTYWGARSVPLKLCAIVAGASIIGVYVCCYSDNTINYSMATFSMPFGFYGMMLGLRQSEQIS